MKRNRKMMLGAAGVAMALAVTILFIVTKKRDFASSPTLPTSAEVPRTLNSAADMNDLLMDSWVVDPVRSYFVEGAWSTNSTPFSLYETQWQTRWSQDTATISPQRARPWLQLALRGKLPDGLPKLVQVNYGVDLLIRLGQPFDPEAVTREMESTRSDGRYGSNPGAEGTWGSTALAVQTHRWLMRPTPKAVAEHARVAFLSYPEPFGPSEVAEDVLPLVDVVTSLYSDDPIIIQKAKLAVTRASELLEAIPLAQIDSRYLGVRYGLHLMMTRLSIGTSKLDNERCDHLLNELRVVPRPESTAGDTQATYYARELGCVDVAAIERPHTRAGWIAPHATGKALPATLSAMRIAKAAGLNDQFAQKVKATLVSIWIPELRNDDRNAARRSATHARISELIAHLEAKISEPGLPHTELSTVPPLIKVVDAFYSPTPNREVVTEAVQQVRAGLPSAGISIDTVLMFEIASRILADDGLHREALSILHSLRIRQGVFAALPCHNETCHARQASIAASAIGSWVENSPEAPHQFWLASSMCNGLVCHDDQEPGISLRLVAVAIACMKPHCGDLPPVVL